MPPGVNHARSLFDWVILLTNVQPVAASSGQVRSKDEIAMSVTGLAIHGDSGRPAALSLDLGF